MPAPQDPPIQASGEVAPGPSVAPETPRPSWWDPWKAGTITLGLLSTILALILFWNSSQTSMHTVDKDFYTKVDDSRRDCDSKIEALRKELEEEKGHNKKHEDEEALLRNRLDILECITSGGKVIAKGKCDLEKPTEVIRTPQKSTIPRN
jgi:hypothetical protein